MTLIDLAGASWASWWWAGSRRSTASRGAWRWHSGIGANEARFALLGRLVAASHTVASVVHPSAVVASGVEIGDGTFVAPLAVIHTEARVGRACIVNSGAVVEHDNVLGDGVHVSPNAALGGNVTLGSGVHMGLGAVVLPGLTVGAGTVVGAGAVVIEDVPGGVTVVGIPARPREPLAP